MGATAKRVQVFERALDLLNDPTAMVSEAVLDPVQDRAAGWTGRSSERALLKSVAPSDYERSTLAPYLAQAV